MATPSGEAAQKFTSATSKRRLDKEAWAALLRVRTGPECPEGNLRELTWDSNPDCGIAILWKALTWDIARPGHITKDCTELAGCTLAIPCLSQVSEDSQSWKGAIAVPERHHLPNWKQALLLSKTSWNSGWSTFTRRVAARDQLSRIETRNTWEGPRVVHPENWAAGTREEIRCTLYLGVTVLTKHLVTWDARTWEGHKTRAQLSLHLCGVPENLNLSDLDLGRHSTQGPPQTVLAEQARAWTVKTMKAHTLWAGANPV